MRNHRTQARASNKPHADNFDPGDASRHCTAPGKRLHRARCGPQRRWCATDRDLRGAGRRSDQRQARVTQATTRGAGPALQCRSPVIASVVTDRAQIR